MRLGEVVLCCGLIFGAVSDIVMLRILRGLDQLLIMMVIIRW